MQCKVSFLGIYHWSSLSFRVQSMHLRNMSSAKIISFEFQDFNQRFRIFVPSSKACIRGISVVLSEFSQNSRWDFNQRLKIHLSKFKPWLFSPFGQKSLSSVDSFRVVWSQSAHFVKIFINLLYTGGLFHYYMLVKSICHLRGVWSILWLP